MGAGVAANEVAERPEDPDRALEADGGFSMRGTPTRRDPIPPSTNRALASSRPRVEVRSQNSLARSVVRTSLPGYVRRHEPDATARWCESRATSAAGPVLGLASARPVAALTRPARGGRCRPHDDIPGVAARRAA